MRPRGATRTKQRNRNVVRARVPLRGLERLAERLNAFEAAPLRALGAAPLRALGGLFGPAGRLARAGGPGAPRSRRRSQPGSSPPDWHQLAGVTEWLFPSGSVDTRFVELVPDEVRAGTPAAFSAAVRELFRRVVGNALMEHLRRCDACGRWMVARYRNRLRCGPRCHAQVWSRAYRRAHAKPGLERARKRAHTGRIRPDSSLLQPKRQTKTPR